MHPKNIYFYIQLTILLCVVLLLPLVASSNTTTDNIAKLNETLSAQQKEIDRLSKETTSTLAKLGKNATPNEEEKSLIASLEKSNTWLNQATESIAATKSYANVLGNAEKLKAELEKKLNKSVDYIQAEKVTRISLDELNNLNNQVVLDLETERSVRADLETRLNQLNDRREKIGNLNAKFNERLLALNQVGAAPETKTGKENSTSDLIRNVELLYVSQKLIELEWEQRSYEIRRDLLRGERQLSEKKVLSFEKNATVIQEALNLARTKAATQSIATAETASKRFENAHPAIQEILSVNQKLATESAEIALKITELTKDKQLLEQDLEYFRQSFSSIKDKISSAGLSETIGIRLRSAKNQLPDLSAFAQRLENRKSEVDKVQLRRIELEDRLLELVDIHKDTENIINNLKLSDDNEKKRIEKQLNTILSEQKNEFLPNTLKTYDNYFEKTLLPLLEKEKEFVKLISDYEIYIDERILWVKSSQLFSYNDFLQSLKSITWIANPGAWSTVLQNLSTAAINNLFLSVILVLSIAGSFFARKSLVDRIRHYGRYKTKLSLAKFGDSLKSGIVTLMLAAYWPIFLWVLALAISSSGSSDVFSQAVSQGLVASANVLFFVFLFLQMVRTSGLAESHFRWKADNIKLVKHQLYWFAPSIIPFVFILQMTNNQPIQSHFDGLGRLAFIAITILMSALLYKLLSPSKGLFKDAIQQDKEGWLNRTRFIWFPLFFLLPTSLAATAVFGYLYTATELMMLLIDSFWVILGAIVTRGFLIRGLNIAQRKLAIEQARKRIATHAEAEQKTAHEQSGTEAAPAQPTAEETEIDIGQISNQTYSLLNNFTGLAIAIGLYLIWADILPALNMLDSVTLWESGSTLSDGQVITSSVTLTDGLTALAILLITTLVGVNIPGLLEIAILQRLPFTPSARYGITTIARYVIIIMGTILTFNAIGIGWSKVQWLAAAITVGLGFGLQEIFANFVSGIIILIERQIRVGDAVTVGNISGRVSKIKMRATTIVDWDKKELIIPNKEFVTGQVVNWTLSDTIIRLVIPVGIAYGSDTKKAHDLLLEVAKANEVIMKDPAPEAFFAGFGPSSLDFELRVFLPNSDLRVSTRHDLLMQIDNAFRKEKIEIAFPQHDLHIRSLPEGMELKVSKP